MRSPGELHFLRAGCRFTWAWVPALTPTGHATQRLTVRVQGPADAALQASLREAVQARRGAVRRPVPRGTCETCGGEVPVVIADGTINLTCGGGSCKLCFLARIAEMS